MKSILAFALTVGLTSSVFANDLETDDSFFKSIKNEDVQEDALDRSIKSQKNQENAVNSEFSDATPGALSAHEAAFMDQKVLLDNKRRQEGIIRKLSNNSFNVRQCVEDNKKNFNGSKITVTWWIETNGKVANAEIKNTDIDNPDIHRCVLQSAVRLNFADVLHGQFKKNVVDYTYSINIKKKPLPVRQHPQRAAKMKTKSPFPFGRQASQ